MTDRPHRFAGRLSREQYLAIRAKMTGEYLTWSQVLNACLNAYILGDINIRPDGTYWTRGTLVHDGEDPDAVELDFDALSKQAKAALKPRLLRTPALAEVLEHMTCRRVSIPMLRLLLRRHFEHLKPNPHKQWGFMPDDPAIDQMSDLIVDGELDRLRDEQFQEFDRKNPMKPTQRKD